MGAEQARQADAVALSDRQRRQRALPVGARAERLEGDIDPAFGVPGVQAGGRVQGDGVALVGAGSALGEGEGRLVQCVECRERGGQRGGRQRADGLTVTR